MTTAQTTTAPTYTGTYRTVDGARIHVEASRGTQATGHVTGAPIDATDPGPTTLEVSEPGQGVTVFLRLTDDDLDALGGILRRAERIIQTRDHTLDAPYPGQ